LHASPETVVAVGTATGKVGRANVVGVAGGGTVAVAVGGMGVGLGRAACVCAAMVNAIATAEACTLAASIVGVAFGPHAVNRMVSAKIRGRTFFIVNTPSIYF
jgi:hypothetical protein